MIEKLTPEQIRLIEDNHDLTYWYMGKNGLDFDEWYDIVVFGLIRTAQCYDPSKGAFSTLACKNMRNQILLELRYRSFRFKPEQLQSLDLELSDASDSDTMHEIVGDKNEPYEKIIDRMAAEEIKQFCLSNVKKESHKEALRLLFDGKNHKEVAKIIGVSHQAIFDMTNRLKKKYKDYCQKNNIS